MILMRIALICFFLSTSASANVLDSCAKVYGILLGKPVHYANLLLSPTTFALKQKIMRRFSQLGGHRPYLIANISGINKDDYRKGLANLATALEGSGPIWDRVKILSLSISDSSRIRIHQDLNSAYAEIPYNTATHSLSINLSIRLLEFAIERKFKQRLSRANNAGLTNVQYKVALEAFYNALEKGPVPEEMEKLDDIAITKGSDISSPWSKLTDEDIFQTDLHIPVHAVEDLEGMAISVLEVEIGKRLARDYAYIGRYGKVGNAIVNAGVDRQTYREVLEKIIKKLTEDSIIVENFRPEDTDSIGLKNLARIHITDAGRDSIRERDDGLFDLYLPAGMILDDAPLALPSSLPLLP